MSRLGGMERTRLPDYSIGATVLVVAIALPFFVFTRAEHLQRVAATKATVAPTPTAQVEAVITSPDPTTSAVPTSIPQAVSKASPTPRPTAKRVTAAPAGVPARPTAAPTSTPTPLPDAPPVAALSFSGLASMTVTADASGSTDTDQTPIAQVIFNFGDGTVVTAQASRTATHTYARPGSYIVSVAVIDTAHLSSTYSLPITVN